MASLFLFSRASCTSYMLLFDPPISSWIHNNVLSAPYIFDLLLFGFLIILKLASLWSSPFYLYHRSENDTLKGTSKTRKANAKYPYLKDVISLVK